jgi:catechol 2,3-dioxygenase-like lactoylglutathione lyase family enzyme
MRLDHIAYRTADRNKTSQFFIDAFGYKVDNEFDIKFTDEYGKLSGVARCMALTPPEKLHQVADSLNLLWSMNIFQVDYHLAPEIFVSDGTPESIVGKWVQRRGGVGGIHHLAYQVEDVRAVAKEWVDNGWAEFNGDVLTCPEDDLDQIFTKPHPLTGVIYEFISRGRHGFCKSNVGRLMESTKDNDMDSEGYYK